MNRLLGVHVDMQRKIFDYFTALQVRPAGPWARPSATRPDDWPAAHLLRLI